MVVNAHARSHTLALLIVVLFRGYRRGFLREIADLALLVVGAVVAFARLVRARRFSRRGPVRARSSLAP